MKNLSSKTHLFPKHLMINIQQHLMKAIEDKDLDNACMVLDRLGGLGHHVDENTYKDLIKLGAQAGHVGLMTRLPADVLKISIGDVGESAMHIAAAHNQDKAVERLIELGADASQPDLDGLTPSVWAAEKGHRETTRKILDLQGREKDVDALCAAARSGHLALVDDLLDYASKNNAPYTTSERDSALKICPRSHRCELERIINSVDMAQNIMSAMNGVEMDTTANSSVKIDTSGAL